MEVICGRLVPVKGLQMVLPQIPFPLNVRSRSRFPKRERDGQSAGMRRGRVPGPTLLYQAILGISCRLLGGMELFVRLFRAAVFALSTQGFLGSQIRYRVDDTGERP